MIMTPKMSTCRGSSGEVGSAQVVFVFERVEFLHFRIKFRLAPFDGNVIVLLSSSFSLSTLCLPHHTPHTFHLLSLSSVQPFFCSIVLLFPSLLACLKLSH